MAQLLMPFHLFPVRDFKALGHKLSPEKLRRLKRSALHEGSIDNRVYLDSIGVPRGVPDEFKARNQVASGFDSFLFWWATINKNVDWRNYIYYNQQRFATLH